jgi:hypothetical protein
MADDDVDGRTRALDNHCEVGSPLADRREVIDAWAVTVAALIHGDDPPATLRERWTDAPPGAVPARHTVDEHGGPRPHDRG